MGWVDDETLVVEANAGPQPKTGAEASAGRKVKYLWKLGAPPRRIDEGPELAQAGFCESKAPLVRKGEPWGVAAGMPANFREYIPQVGCEVYRDISMVDRPYLTDTDRRYYLEFSPTRYGIFSDYHSSGKVFLQNSNGAGRQQLPIWNSDVTRACTHYERSAEDFYLWTCLGIGRSADRPSVFDEWKASGCRPVWRVHPADTSTEEICLPFGDWAGNIEIVPTRAGLFTTTDQWLTKTYPTDPGAAGLYKFEDGKIRRILGGYLVYPMVSPNGCRIAFFLHPSRRVGIAAPYPGTTMAIDVCSIS